MTASVLLCRHTGASRATVRPFALATIFIGVLAIAIAAGPAGPFVPPVLAQPATSGVIGLGFWSALGCVGCAAGFIVGAGATIAGLAVFVAANPEITILCVSTCVAAAT